MVYHHRQWLTKVEIEAIAKIKFWDQVFYATATTFIGFNLINSLTIKSTGTEVATKVFELDIPIIYIYSVIFSPLIEELICRKYLFKWLDAKTGFMLAALLSSIVFSIPHFDPISTPGYIFIGMVWCWYYRQTDNILVPIVSHACFNYLVILITSMKG
jgi:hypothetical protein